MKITKQRIRDEALYHGGPCYQGPKGFTIPMVFMTKMGIVHAFNNLKTYLNESIWSKS